MHDGHVFRDRFQTHTEWSVMENPVTTRLNKPRVRRFAFVWEGAR